MKKPFVLLHAKFGWLILGLVFAVSCTLGEVQTGSGGKDEYPPSREAWYKDLTPEQREGLDTWYLWTAGNQKFFRQLAIHGGPDFLEVAQTPRDQRFQLLGMINNPDCEARTEPDEYGLMLDKCDDPNDVGIMGMRKFKNPDFDLEKWDSQKYDVSIEPPYLIGLSCGVCHVAYNPINPPKNPNEPKWKNLLPAFGNQYIDEGALYAASLPKDDFAMEVLRSQQRGTSDTSRNATDHINNPNAINSIQNLAYRPTEPEKMQGTPETDPFLWEDADAAGTRQVHHILKDGADSVGVAGASLRVYVNIGMCSDYWLTLHDLGRGLKRQQPFDIEMARKECEAWQQTEAKLVNVEAYLKTQGPLYLKDAPGGEAYITEDWEVLKRGALAFANSCTSCHSSKEEPAGLVDNQEKRAEWYLSEDFRDGNFLSDDRRYPVTEIQTNIARAMATNATGGQIWENFSSQTYKELPSAGKLEKLLNPLTGQEDIDFELPAGGRGYYRTPTLISIWATAPYLHNNSIGKYTGDPSVEGRMKTFDDAIEKLLGLKKRDKRVKRTERDTTLRLPGPDGTVIEVPVPKGTPINVLANIDPRTLPKDLDLSGGLAALARQFLKLNPSPDFVEDRGHDFVQGLSDEDKKALIEFLKTL